MKNKGIKFSKVFVKITALVIIQAFLVLDFAWCGGNELFSKQANSDTLAPHLTIQEKTVEGLFSRGLPGQEKSAAVAELTVEQTPVAQPSRTGFMAKVLGYALSLFIIDGAVSFLSAAVSKAGIISTGISLSGIIPILIPAIVMVGIVAMIGGKAGDWASNLFVGFVKDGRITTEEAVRQAKELERARAAGRVLDAVEAHYKRELRAWIENIKMFKIVGENIYKIDEKVFSDAKITAISAEFLKKEFVINLKLKDHEKLSLEEIKDLKQMYTLAFPVYKYWENKVKVNETPKQVFDKAEFNLFKERGLIVPYGEQWAINLNWTNDKGKGNTDAANFAYHTNSTLEIYARAQDLLSTLGLKVEKDKNGKLDIKDDESADAQSPAKPVNAGQQPLKGQRVVTKIGRRPPPLTGDKKRQYEEIEKKLKSLNDVYNLIKSGRPEEIDITKIQEDIISLAANLPKHYKFKIDTQGKVIAAEGIAELDSEIPVLFFQDLHALGDQLADWLLTEVEIDGEIVTLLRLLIEGKVQIVMLGDIMHPEDKEAIETASEEYTNFLMKILGRSGKRKTEDFYRGLIKPARYTIKEIYENFYLKGKQEEALRKIEAGEAWAPETYKLVARSLAAKNMVMFLKENASKHFHMITGNHDMVDNVLLGKYGFYVSMIHNYFMRAMAKEEKLIKAIGLSEDVQPLAVYRISKEGFDNIVGLHGPNWMKEMTFEEVRDNHPNARESLTTYKTEKEKDKPENHENNSKDLLKKFEAAVNAPFKIVVNGHKRAKHKRGVEKINLGEGYTELRVNKPRNLVSVGYIERQKEPLEDRNVVNIENIGEFVKEAYNYWAKQLAIPETPAPSATAPEETQMSAGVSEQSIQQVGEKRYLPEKGITDVKKDNFFDCKENELIAIALGKGIKTYTLLLKKTKDTYLISGEGTQGIAFELAGAEEKVVRVGAKKGFNDITFLEEAQGIVEPMHLSFKVAGNRITIEYVFGETAIRYAISDVIAKFNQIKESMGKTVSKKQMEQIIASITGEKDIILEAALKHILGEMRDEKLKEIALDTARVLIENKRFSPTLLDDLLQIKKDIENLSVAKPSPVPAEPKKAPVFTAAFIKGLFENAVGKGIEGRTALSKELDLRIKQNSEAIEEAIEDILKSDGNEEKREIAATEVKRLVASGEFSAEALSKLLEVFNLEPEFFNLTTRTIGGNLFEAYVLFDNKGVMVPIQSGTNAAYVVASFKDIYPDIAARLTQEKPAPDNKRLNGMHEYIKQLEIKQNQVLVEQAI